MLDLTTIGRKVADERKGLGLSQSELARQAGVSRATLEALENGRARELGFSRLTRLLEALRLELRLQPAGSGQPAPDEPVAGDRDHCAGTSD